MEDRKALNSSSSSDPAAKMQATANSTASSPPNLKDPIFIQNSHESESRQPESDEKLIDTATNGQLGFEPSIRQRIHGLDELRGIAILTVIFSHHFNPSRYHPFQHFHFGGVGVDLFFLISGFLIGKILIDSRGTPNYFRRFYVRRIFRIFPLYFSVVFGAILLAWLLNPSYLRSAPFYLTFTQNWIFDPDRPLANLLDESYQQIPGLGPLWSLAVEEQFYLLMPCLIAFVSQRWLPLLLTAVAMAGCYFDVHYAITPEGNDWTYWNYYANARLTHVKMQYLAMGVLFTSRDRWRYLLPCIVAFLAFIVLHQHWFMLLCWSFLILMLVVIDLALYHQKYLQQRQLAWCGIVCFGLYVLHIPFQIVFRGVWNRLPFPAWADAFGFLTYLASLFAIAWLSFHFFENPIQRLRTRFEGR